MVLRRNENGQLKMTKWFKITASAVSIVIAVVGSLWGAFSCLEDRYASAEDLVSIEKRIEINTVNTFEKQQRILDIRYLEQLQCQKAILEKELERDPGDSLIEEKLERVERQIERIENSLYE